MLGGIENNLYWGRFKESELRKVSGRHQKKSSFASIVIFLKFRIDQCLLVPEPESFSQEVILDFKDSICFCCSLIASTNIADILS